MTGLFTNCDLITPRQTAESFPEIANGTPPAANAASFLAPAIQTCYGKPYWPAFFARSTVFIAYWPAFCWSRRYSARIDPPFARCTVFSAYWSAFCWVNKWGEMGRRGVDALEMVVNC